MTSHRSIVLDIGTRYIRGGFAGEFSPRFVMEHHIFRRDDAGMQLRFYLMEVFNRIFSQHCLVKAKACDILIVEKILIQKKIRDYMLSVLLKDFQVHSVSFQPDLYMSILATGYSTGVVVNIGSRECNSICIVDGRPLIHTLFTAAVGVNHAVESLRIAIEERKEKLVAIEAVELLFERVACHCFETAPISSSSNININSSINNTSSSMNNTTGSINININNNSSSIGGGGGGEMVECEDIEVAPAQGLAGEAFTLSEEDRQEIVYGIISGECPIQGCLDENGGAAGILMRSLRACGIDARFHCAQNIILCGGGAMIPGLKEAICAEATDMAHSEPHFQLLLERMVYKLHTQHLSPLSTFPFPPACLPWIGASVFASIPENKLKYVTLQDMIKRQQRDKQLLSKFEFIDSLLEESQQEAALQLATLDSQAATTAAATTATAVAATTTATAAAAEQKLEQASSTAAAAPLSLDGVVSLSSSSSSEAATAAATTAAAAAAAVDTHVVQLLVPEEVDDPDYLLDAPDWQSLSSSDWTFCRGGLFHSSLHTQK